MVSNVTGAAVRQEFRVDGLSEPLSHYTDAVRFGDLLFISGIAPLDENQNVVGGDNIVEQTEHIFKCMSKVLEQAGADFSNILKVTVYMTSVEDRAAVNAVRKRYFGSAKPASTLIGVSALAVPGMKIEIEAVVGLPAGH